MPVDPPVQAEVKTQANQRHWAGIGERGSLLGLQFMLFLYRLGGRWLFKVIAVFVVGYFYLTSPSARQASSEYLNRLWAHSGRGAGGATGAGSGLASKPTVWTSIRHFLAFADAILDKISAWQGDIPESQVDCQNRDLFEQRYAAGAGGVWITSHLGNIEVCRAISQKALKFRLTVLVHTKHASKFNKVMQQVDPHSSVEMLEVSGFNVATAAILRERISRGYFVVIVGDRTSVTGQGRNIICSFLGHEAAFPLGPYMLAVLLDCPVGTLFCVRDGNRHRMFIDDLPGLQGIPRRQRAAAIDAAAATYAQRLEQLCARYPLQWFNFFPFWHNPAQPAVGNNPGTAQS